MSLAQLHQQVQSQFPVNTTLINISYHVRHFFSGELSDRSNREMNALKLLTAMSKLRVDFGLTQDDILDMSDRDGVLLALHLFQVP